MKKSIDFWTTSNAAVEIVVMTCPYCEGEFYEIDDHELGDCPLCNAAFDQEPTKEGYDSSTYTLIVDHKTGVPSVIKMSEYEPVMRAAPSSQTDSQQRMGRIRQPCQPTDRTYTGSAENKKKNSALLIRKILSHEQKYIFN